MLYLVYPSSFLKTETPSIFILSINWFNRLFIARITKQLLHTYHRRCGPRKHNAPHCLSILPEAACPFLRRIKPTLNKKIISSDPMTFLPVLFVFFFRCWWFVSAVSTHFDLHFQSALKLSLHFPCPVPCPVSKWSIPIPKAVTDKIASLQRLQLCITSHFFRIFPQTLIFALKRKPTFFGRSHFYYHAIQFIFLFFAHTSLLLGHSLSLRSFVIACRIYTHTSPLISCPHHIMIHFIKKRRYLVRGIRQITLY